MERIKEGMKHDQAQAHVQYARDAKIRRFYYEDGVLYTRGQCLFMTQHRELRKEVLQECHDRTMDLSEERYYGPNMCEDNKAYVHTCLVCQHDNIEHWRAVHTFGDISSSEAFVGKHVHRLYRKSP